MQLENRLGAGLPFWCTGTHALQPPTPATPQNAHVSLYCNASEVHAEFGNARTTPIYLKSKNSSNRAVLSTLELRCSVLCTTQQNLHGDCRGHIVDLRRRPGRNLVDFMCPSTCCRISRTTTSIFQVGDPTAPATKDAGTSSDALTNRIASGDEVSVLRTKVDGVGNRLHYRNLFNPPCELTVSTSTFCVDNNSPTLNT